MPPPAPSDGKGSFRWTLFTLPVVDDHDADEVHLVARGIATAVAPETGLTDVQADLLEAIASALTGVSVDYRALEPLGPDELAECWPGATSPIGSGSSITWCSASWCCDRSRPWSRTGSRSMRKRSA